MVLFCDVCDDLLHSLFLYLPFSNLGLSGVDACFLAGSGVVMTVEGNPTKDWELKESYRRSGV